MFIRPELSPTQCAPVVSTLPRSDYGTPTV